jgi:putative ABC transport system permease protein
MTICVCIRNTGGDFVNIKKIIKLNFIIGLLVFIVLFSTSTYLNYELNQDVPNMLEYKKINSEGISFTKLNELKEKCKELIFTGYSEISCKVKNIYDVFPGKDIKTKVVMTDEKFFSLYPYEFIEGGKLDYLSVQNGNKVAVISDNLAIDLYKSTKVIGDIIYINDEKYKIVGVYRTNKSLAYNISDDGYERIIIPYSAYTLHDKKEGLSIDVFTTMETGQNTSQKINNKLTKILGTNLSEYNMFDYTLSKKISFQYTRILYFSIGSLCIVILIKVLIKYFKKFITSSKESLKTNYFWEVIKENKKEISTISIKVFLCLASIIVIFSLIKFNIAINDNYLPSDNIFDLDFYRETIVKNMQLTNANESGFGNVYNRYLTNISGIEKTALIGEILAFVFIVINGMALIKLKWKH